MIRRKASLSMFCMILLVSTTLLGSEHGKDTAVAMVQAKTNVMQSSSNEALIALIKNYPWPNNCSLEETERKRRIEVMLTLFENDHVQDSGGDNQ